MKESTLSGIAIMFVISCMLIFSGCKSAFHATYDNAPVCMVYPSEKGVIKDQSQLSTIIIQNTYSLKIDSIEVVNKAGKFNQELRTASNSSSKSAYIIDILPGKHTLEVTYSNFSRSGGKATSWYTQKPIVETFYFEPGEIYTLELKIFDMAAKLMSLKKVDTSSPNGIALNPLPDKYRQAIIECRHNVSF